MKSANTARMVDAHASGYFFPMLENTVRGERVGQWMKTCAMRRRKTKCSILCQCQREM